MLTIRKSSLFQSKNQIIEGISNDQMQKRKIKFNKLKQNNNHLKTSKLINIEIEEKALLVI